MTAILIKPHSHPVSTSQPSSWPSFLSFSSHLHPSAPATDLPLPLQILLHRDLYPIFHTQKPDQREPSQTQKHPDATQKTSRCAPPVKNGYTGRSYIDRFPTTTQPTPESSREAPKAGDSEVPRSAWDRRWTLDYNHQLILPIIPLRLLIKK